MEKYRIFEEACLEYKQFTPDLKTFGPLKKTCRFLRDFSYLKNFLEISEFLDF